MTIPCHPLFAPTGTLKIRTAAYVRIHAALRAAIKKPVQRTKRQRHSTRSKIFKQTAELL